MSTDGRTLAIIGMSGAGKSTYIGRLWLSVQERLGRLHAKGLPQRFKPLKDLSEYLLNSKFPPHTRTGDLTPFEVPLQWSDTTSSLSFTLSFTDYSGEELEDIFKYRDSGWSKAWKARATQSLGLLLFLRPHKIILPISARLVDPPDNVDTASFRYLRGELQSEPIAASFSANDPALLLGREFQPEQSEEEHRRPHPAEPARPPTALALVETLQFLRHERGLVMGELPDADGFRIAVIVSCWDGVPDDLREKGPEPFVQGHFSLLNEFLRTNFDETSIRFFGISSTGGDLGTDSYKEQYDKLEPAKVGEVVYHPTPGGSVKSDPDITLPIGWLLEGENVFLSPDAS